MSVESNIMGSHVLSSVSGAGTAFIKFFNSQPLHSIGNSPVGGSGLETYNSNKQPLNRLLRFLNKTYFSYGGIIYEYDQEVDTFNWSINTLLHGAIGSTSKHLGLYAVNITGVPYMATAWQDGATSTWRAGLLNSENNVWSSGITGTVENMSEANGSVRLEIQHRNKIYFMGSTNTWGVLDLNEMAIKNGGFDRTAYHPMDWAVYNDILYCLGKTGGAGDERTLFKLEGSTFVRALDVANPTIGWPAPTSTTNFSGRNCMLIVDSFKGTNSTPQMYSTIVYDSGGSFYVRTLKLTNAAEEISWEGPVEVFHTEPGGDTSSHLDSFMYIVDSQGIGSPSGGNQQGIQDTIFWTFRGDLGWRNEAQWNYVGPNAGAALPSFPNTPASPHQAYSNSRLGGGDRWHLMEAPSNEQTVTQADIVLRSAATGLTGQEIILTYTMHPTLRHPAGTPVATRFYYDENGFAPNKVCTLTDSKKDGSSHGTIEPFAGGSLIQSMVMESGSTYTAEWRPLDEGIENYTFINIFPRLVTSGVI